VSLDVARALALVQAEVRAGREASTGVVVSADDEALVGRRLVRSVQGLQGTLGTSAADAAANRLLEGTLVGLQTMDDGIELYVERWAPLPELIVVGAGHIARPLAAIGLLLEFRVLVLDDRPEFATPRRFPGAEVRVVDFADPFTDLAIGPRTHIVLVTRGHRHDYDCLLALARKEVEPAYVGMIGSRRRVRAAFEQLAGEGIGAEWLSRIRAPLGLDIGSETPAEIAVAVAADIVLAARGGSGRPLAERADVLRHVRALSRTEAGNGS
jgi:xanthine dehydrogenase accessory factor